MNNSNYTIGNRARDLPACSAVPQSTALPRAPDHILYIHIYVPILVFINTTGMSDLKIYFLVWDHKFSLNLPFEYYYTIHFIRSLRPGILLLSSEEPYSGIKV